MPQSPTPSMLLVQPSENGDAGVWDTILTTLFLLIDGHDHSTGKGVKVKPIGLDINADLTYSSGGSYFAAKDLKAVDLQPQAASAVTSYASALFANSDDSNNLYFRTNSGTNVRITNGTTLDISGTGGIVGDYTSAGAEVRFDDATDAYWFRQQLGGGVQQYARMRCGDVELFEYKAHPTGTVPGQRVRLASPAGLGSSYTVTYPSVVPGANGTLMQFTTAGVASFSNSNLAATTFASTISVTGAATFASTVGITGAASCSTTLSVSGQTTLSNGIANNVSLIAGATASSNQHITVSGTGRFKHGDLTMTLSAISGSGTWTPGSDGDIASSAGSQDWAWTAPLDIGKRIRSVTFHFNRGGGTLTFDVRRRASGSANSIATTTVGSGTGFQTVTLSSIDYTVSTTEVIYLRVLSGSASDFLYGATVVYDHP